MVNRESAYELLRLLSSMLSFGSESEFCFSEKELSELYRTAKAHSLCAITADVLKKSGSMSDAFREAQAKAKRYDVLSEMECRRICEKLAENQIAYVLLKGSVLKKYYPKPYDREMKDVDILIDPSRRDDVRRIMEEAGFQTAEFGTYKDDVYLKRPIYIFEMHNNLFDLKSDRQLNEYYRDIWKKLLRVENSEWEKRFSDEDFYIYMILHTKKHFVGGGVGLKYLLDTYLFLQKAGCDFSWEYVSRELKLLGAEEFELQHRTLAQKVFSSAALSKEEKALLDEYLLYGAHGTQENYIAHQLTANTARKHGTARYILRRAFPMGDDLPYGYDFFNRHKALLPLLWIYRPIKAAVRYPASVAKEIKTVQRVKAKYK